MREIYRLTLIVALVAVLTPLASAFAAPSAATVTIDPAAIDRYVEAQREAARIPGLAVGIVRGGKVAYLKGYGVADPSGRGVTAQTPFMLGSVSNSFTALAVMRLVEAGKVDLDAPVRRYLPWFGMADAAASDAITIRQLLYHTSGISRSDGEVAYVDNPNASIESIVRGMASLKLDRAIGESHEYSNLNYDVLGAVVEAVSGQTFGDYVRGQIFVPLGMTHSYVTLADAQRGGLATGYRYTFGAVVPTGNPYSPGNLPSGYLISSAEDMARYLAMWLGSGPQVVLPAGLDELRRPGVPAMPGGYTKYAMGWYSNPDGSVLWHNGSTLNQQASVRIMRPGGSTPEGIGVVVLYDINDDALQAILGQGFPLVDGIISVMYGERPPSVGNPVQGLFIADLVGLVALVMLGYGAARAWRSRGLPPPVGGHVFVSVTVTTLALFVSLGILLGVSRAVSWWVVLATMPDYGYLTLFFCLGLFALTIARVALLFGQLSGYKLGKARK